jgi:hypothetical protein
MARALPDRQLAPAPAFRGDRDESCEAGGGRPAEATRAPCFRRDSARLGTPMSSLRTSPPGSILYHYTSANGLLGILDSRVLWATDIRFLNDSTEFLFARDLLVSHVRRRALRLRNEHVRQVIEREVEDLASTAVPAYVVCFSEQGNSLSQWRAYAPRDGVAIGFHRGALENVNDFVLRRCEYIHESALTRAEQNSLKRVTEELDDAIAWTSRLVQQADRRTTVSVSEEPPPPSVMSQALIWLALQIKHAGFEEEREWRLIDNRSPLEVYEMRQAGTDDRRFRPGAFGLTPYLLAVLPEAWGSVPLGIAEVIVGPGPNSHAVVASIEELLEGKLRSTARVRHCGIPYRAW